MREGAPHSSILFLSLPGHKFHWQLTSFTGSAGIFRNPCLVGLQGTPDPPLPGSSVEGQIKNSSCPKALVATALPVVPGCSQTRGSALTRSSLWVPTSPHPASSRPPFSCSSCSSCPSPQPFKGRDTTQGRLLKWGCPSPRIERAGRAHPGDGDPAPPKRTWLPSSASPQFFLCRLKQCLSASHPSPCSGRAGERPFHHQLQ